MWWQPPDWADGRANPPQLSQERYGSAAMHAAVASTFRTRAAAAGISHVAAGANWSAPAAVRAPFVAWLARVTALPPLSPERTLYIL